MCSLTDGMPDDVKRRYHEKISAINSKDPYSLRMNAVDIPATVSTGHVVQYLLNHRSPYSGNPINNRKSLEAYKKFENGFVSSVEGLLINGRFVVRGKVQRSMRLSEPPHVPWIILEQDGTIRAAHCKCPVGLTESCSHVASVLYSLANLHSISVNQKVTPTDVPAYWVKPSKGIKEDLFHKVQDINYGHTTKRFNDIECKGASENDFLNLVKKLKQEGSQAAVIRKFCEAGLMCNSCEEFMVPDNMFLNKNILIQGMFNEENEKKTIEELRTIAEHIEFRLDPEEIAEVERLTRRQSSEPFWTYVRIGRITASVMKEAISTSTEYPPPKLSLVKKICHPYLTSVETPATLYGKRNESRAQEYVKVLYKSHEDASVTECGIFLYQEKPFIAASPDMMIHCTCCGRTCVEIKCPYRLKSHSSLDDQLTIANLANMKQSFVEIQNGVFKLVETHNYYYQIQTQMFVTNSDQGLFIIWSKKEQVEIVVEKNLALWINCMLRSERYFRRIICPELLANYYTNSLSPLVLN